MTGVLDACRKQEAQREEGERVTGTGRLGVHLWGWGWELSRSRRKGLAPSSSITMEHCGEQY